MRFFALILVLSDLYIAHIVIVGPYQPLSLRFPTKDVVVLPSTSLLGTNASLVLGRALWISWKWRFGASYWILSVVITLGPPPRKLPSYPLQHTQNTALHCCSETRYEFRDKHTHTDILSELYIVGYYYSSLLFVCTIIVTAIVTVIVIIINCNFLIVDQLCLDFLI